jgi:uncharacterized membrane protein
MRGRSWLLLCVSVLSLAACGSDKKEAGECPAELSYLTTAKPFVSKYCVSCHSVGSTDRGGAPADVNFGEEANLFTHGTHIHEYVNDKVMPPAGEPQPTAAERNAFIAWTECSGVSESHDGH